MEYILSDIEIINWNSRLSDLKGSLSINPIYSKINGSYTSIPSIQFLYNNNINIGNFVSHEIKDPIIKYRYMISISKNRVDFFNKILDEHIESTIKTKHIHEDKIYDITIDDIEFKLSTEEHELNNLKYIRYTYEFKTSLTKIMTYISMIENSIRIFNNIWSYNDDSEEIYLLKYKIGDIISFSSDKSKDYLIIDYNYKNNFTGYSTYFSSKDSTINYICVELLNNGHILKYGESKEFIEKDMCYSRNNRIDSILN
jgi:hypothetical protein